MTDEQALRYELAVLERNLAFPEITALHAARVQRRIDEIRISLSSSKGAGQ